MFTSEVTIKSNVHFPKLRTTVTRTVVSRNTNGTVTYRLSSQNQSDLIAATVLLSKYEFKDMVTVSRKEYESTVNKLDVTTKRLDATEKVLRFTNILLKDGNALIQQMGRQLRSLHS